MTTIHRIAVAAVGLVAIGSVAACAPPPALRSLVPTTTTTPAPKPKPVVTAPKATVAPKPVVTAPPTTTTPPATTTPPVTTPPVTTPPPTTAPPTTVAPVVHTTCQDGTYSAYGSTGHCHWEGNKLLIGQDAQGNNDGPRYVPNQDLVIHLFFPVEHPSGVSGGTGGGCTVGCFPNDNHGWLCYSYAGALCRGQNFDWAWYGPGSINGYDTSASTLPAGWYTFDVSSMGPFNTLTGGVVWTAIEHPHA